MTYTFTRDGAPQIDARNNVYYMAAGNSPSMMAKNVGQGSQYLWTYRDADGDFLDGSKTYKLHILPNIPARNFWSVVVYDTMSRSELQNGQPFPSVSSYTKPSSMRTVRSTSIRPERAEGKVKLDQDSPGKGFFPMFRFYGPANRSSTRRGNLRISSALNDGRCPVGTVARKGGASRADRNLAEDASVRNHSAKETFVQRGIQPDRLKGARRQDHPQMRSHAADRPASVACAPSPCRRRLCWTRPPRVPHDRPNVPPSTIGYWTPNSCVILVFMTCLREACLRAGFYVSNVADCRRWWHPTAGRQLPASANSRSRPGRAQTRSYIADFD